MKKNNHIVIKVAVIGIILFGGLSSCQLLNRYQSPEIETESLYRDNATTDTTTIADIPWRDFFSDPLLVSLIEEGLDKNADMQLALTNIKQAEANLSMAKVAYFPTVSLAGQVTNKTISDANNTLNNTSNNVSLGVASTWELDLWGKLNSHSKAKYAQLLKTYSYRNLIQSTLVANIAVSYYSLLALDEQYRITTETVKLLEENVATMEAYKEAGMQNAAAVEQSKTLMLSTKLSLYGFESRIRKLENSISTMLGRTPGPIVRSSIAIQKLPEELQIGVPAQMLARRPDVKRAELEFRSAFELTNVAQASFYPTLTLNSGSMFGLSSVGFVNFFSLENLMVNVIGGLTQPIFNRGQLVGNLKIAKAQQEAALITFKNTVLEAGQEVSDILFDYESSVKKNSIREEQILAAQNAVEYTKELLIANNANYTEVLTAQQNYLAAKLNQINDKLEQLQYAATLYRALGGGI